MGRAGRILLCASTSVYIRHFVHRLPTGTVAIEVRFCSLCSHPPAPVATCFLPRKRLLGSLQDRLTLLLMGMYNLDCLDNHEGGVEVPWQLQEAKQRFSELVRRALEEGPQVVTRRGEEVVVVVKAEEFDRLSRGEEDFKDFLIDAPDLDSLEIRRDRSPSREVELG